MKGLRTRRPGWKWVFLKVDRWIAFGFGSGLSPWAPGSVGTLVGIPFFWLLSGQEAWTYGFIVTALFGLGVWVCGRAAAELGVHDHPSIVWDEVVGYLVTMFGSPASMGWMFAGVLVFRIFDIFKPPPIGFLDRRVQGGLGIMIDDVLAGLYAWSVLQGLGLFLASP